MGPFRPNDARHGSHGSHEHFHLDRFISDDQEEKQKSNDCTARAWGFGEAPCPGKNFAEKQVLMFVAAIVSLWDVEHTSLEAWEMLKSNSPHVIAGPKKDCRILMQARKL